MMWLILGVLVPVVVAVVWWKRDRRSAFVAIVILMVAGFTCAFLTDGKLGDFTGGMFIGLPVLLAQAVRVNRAERNAGRAR